MIIYGIILSVKIINKDFKNISFWLLLLSVFLNSQIGLGRFGYLEVLVYIIIIYLIVNTSKKNSMKLSINTKRLSQLFII